jgi:iron complex outermembrane receptor protein
MKKTIYFLLFLLLLSLSIQAQCSFSLSGKVIDHHDRKPLEFAEVYIPELKKGTLTDSLGNYVITQLCAGTYTVTCHHMGCDSLVTTVEITGNTIQNFYPEHHLHELGLVDIVTDRVKQENTSTTYEMKGRELDKTRGESLGEALKSIVGVNTIQTGSSISKPVIHGLHSNRVLILNNGIRQESQQWGSEHAPEIDPFVATKLTVIKGANLVRYGSDAIAGVILVEPDKLRDSSGIDAQLNLVGMSNGRGGVASAIVNQNFKKLPALSWRLQGTIKKVGSVSTPTYILKNSAVEEYNFSAAAGWSKTKYGLELFYSQFNTNIGIFSGAHIGNVTDLMAAINRSEPLEKSTFSYKIDRPYQHIEHELFKAKAYLQTGDIGKLSLVYARQYNLRNEFDKDKPRNDSLAALNKPELHFEITSHTLDLSWEHNSLKHFTGTIGVSGMKQGNTYSGRYFIPNFRNYTGGVYWIERFTKNKLQVEAGIRYDYRFLQIYKYVNNVIVSPIYNYQNASGTIGAIYKFNTSTTITVNAGSAWRAPNVNELHSKGIHHGAATYEIGNENLKPEKATNFSASFHYQNEKNWKLEVSPYYMLIHDFIFLQPTFPATVTISGAFPTFEYTQTNARLTGVDALVAYTLFPRFVLSEKISILRAYDTKANDYLIQMPADRFTTELSYEFKEIKHFSETTLSLSGIYENKQWRVPANSDYALPPSAYFLLNCEVSTMVRLNNQSLTIGLGCTNLLNTSYRNYMNRFRYYADEMGRNISIRLKMPINYSQKK